mgnify:CR=1 FL=1
MSIDKGSVQMIIDFHTHTYPEKIAARTVELLAGRSGTVPHSDGTLEGLEENMQQRHVDMSVVLPVATSPKQYKRINEVAQVENEMFKDTHVWSFGGIHPENDNYKEILRDISDKGLKGIKLHPDYQGTFFNDIRYKRIISYASELGLIVVTHAGQDIGLPDIVHCTPAMAEEVLDDVKPDKLVLAHMGGWQMWQDVLDRLCGRNVYLDTAFSYGQIQYKEGVDHRWKLMDSDMFRAIINRHGADKILFGTDSPWSDQSESIADIDGLRLAEDEKRKIMGENAAGLLNLYANWIKNCLLYTSPSPRDA